MQTQPWSPLAYMCVLTHTHTCILSYEVVLLYSTCRRKIIFHLWKTLRTLKWQRGIQVQNFLSWKSGPLHLLRLLCECGCGCGWVHMHTHVHTCTCIWVPVPVEVREKCWVLLNHHSLCFWKHGLSVESGLADSTRLAGSPLNPVSSRIPPMSTW